MSPRKNNRFSRKEFITGKPLAALAGIFGFAAAVANLFKASRRARAGKNYQAKFESSKPGHDPVLAPDRQPAELKRGLS